MAIVFSKNNIITTDNNSKISSNCVVDLTDLELVYSENGMTNLTSNDFYQISFNYIKNIVKTKLNDMLTDFTDANTYNITLNDAIFKLEILDSKIPNLGVYLGKDEDVITGTTVTDSLIQEFIPMENYYIEIQNNSTFDAFFKYEIVVKWSKSVSLNSMF